MLEIDVGRQIAYWRDGALEAIDTAKYLLDGERVSFGMFSVHLALEKAFKAQIVKQTNNLPPRIHDLLRLAKIGKITLLQEQIDFLSVMGIFAIQGCYADMDLPAPSRSNVQQLFNQAKEMTEWLIKLL
jgi:HEPN domain-containing protein